MIRLGRPRDLFQDQGRINADHAGTRLPCPDYRTPGIPSRDRSLPTASGYLTWLGEDGLSQLDRSFARGWRPGMPKEPTETIDLPLPLLKTSRRKTARKLANQIGPVDPDFDQKGFMDELWGED